MGSSSNTATRTTSDHYQNMDSQENTIRTAASIAASIATLNALNQPFVRMQNDIEAKISSIIGKLEMLKENEEQLNEKLLEKKKKKRRDERGQQTNSDEDTDSCFYEKSSGSESVGRAGRKKSREAPSQNGGGDNSRIKYLEKVQDNQVFIIMKPIVTRKFV